VPGGGGRLVVARDSGLIRIERISALALFPARIAMAWPAGGLRTRGGGAVRPRGVLRSWCFTRRTGGMLAGLCARRALGLFGSGSREIDPVGAHDVDFFLQQPLHVG